ncbi:hypothetical protein CPC08DRAFT_730331 [Agrocybe pediades]|nr:hypothetical protein CPC08DRAFT_730331 [Agrocybe pediades]
MLILEAGMSEERREITKAMRKSLAVGQKMRKNTVTHKGGRHALTTTLLKCPSGCRSTSTYCNVCNTRYYPNYWVSNSEDTRTYYVDSESFNFIHVADHVFIETRTLHLFTTMMLNAWTSASNCAQIYNDGVALRSLAPKLPITFSKTLIMDTNDVWDGLMLYWLLEDAQERGEVLVTLHKSSSQSKRVQPAVRARNLRMAGTGQEHWNHICDVCCYVDVDSDGNPDYIRSCVTDGVTIGRPTCSVQDCPNALKSTKNRYCPNHKKEDLLCVVTTCKNMADSGHRTCSLKDHRQIENYNAEHNKAMFQLKHRLAKLKTSLAAASLPTTSCDSNALVDEEEELEVVIDQDGRLECDGKPDKGNKALKARFGRRRTHNEELCVASCGVILGRCTFYGSEAPNGVRTFWKKLFPYKRSLPRILWHDNNCRIMAMLKKKGDEDNYFDSCALPVDVFHFKSKHKETDEDCNRHCNPAQWEILETPDKKWRFNSSIAEQTNAWIGGYQAIVREMEADRYEFFLDEMIKRRNQLLVARLERQNKCPREIPRSELLRPGTPPPLKKRSPDQMATLTGQ